MIHKTMLPSGASFFAGPTGRVLVHSNERGVLEARWSGDFDGEFYEPISVEMEHRLRGAAKWQLFADLSGMKGFSSDFRASWVTWFTRHRDRIERSVFLQRSALVRIGLSIIGVALRGNIESYTDPNDYARAVLPSRLPRMGVRALDAPAAAPPART